MQFNHNSMSSIMRAGAVWLPQLDFPTEAATIFTYKRIKQPPCTHITQHRVQQAYHIKYYTANQKTNLVATYDFWIGMGLEI